MKCFVCQENEPTHTVNGFKLCGQCTEIAKSEVKIRNKIKQCLLYNDRNHIFQYTLGMESTPQVLRIKKIGDKQ